MKPQDFEQAPCHCPQCVQAGVSELPQIRDRHTGKWLHGYDLKRWVEARDSFWTSFHQQVEKRGIR